MGSRPVRGPLSSLKTSGLCLFKETSIVPGELFVNLRKRHWSVTLKLRRGINLFRLTTESLKDFVPKLNPMWGRDIDSSFAFTGC